MFAYCFNNPVNMIDVTGTAPYDLFETMDEAAKDFAENYAEKGYDNRVEYASFIYKVTTYEFGVEMIDIKKHVLCFSFAKGFYFEYVTVGYYYKPYIVAHTRYGYVEPNKGTELRVSMPATGSYKKVAEIHNHTYIEGHYNAHFSPSDLNSYINYLVAPNGTLRKYDPKNINLYSDDGARVISYGFPKDPKWRD